VRFDGKLDKWNDDRGFGFIAPLHGGESVFVHVSAFPRDGRRPKLGEPLTFEVEAAGDGKKRAINVQRPGHRTAADSRRQPPRDRRSRGLPLQRIVVVLILVALGGYGYTKFGSALSTAARVTTDVSATPARSGTPSPPVDGFRCDGRTMCSQMTSCAEAKFFLKNCPGTKMDGDNDGIPCEQQWCNGPVAR
jgi:cold shock CspA family protein